MNLSMIRYIIGYVLRIEAILLLIPGMVSLAYKDISDGIIFLMVAMGSFLFGMLLSVKRPKVNVFYLKEGCVTTALSWIVLSIFGAMPFYISGYIPSYTDALFETISGFTTTGASILTDVEALSHGMLFWRSFTHWIGGMGVLVFLLAVIPLTGGSNMNLMKAESPGPSVGKLAPKVKSTAQILYGIYVAMTVLECILLYAGKMSLFESVTLSFGTAGTGGFGVLNDSVGSATPYQQWVITIFMILFGVNFNFYALILFGQIKKAFKTEEVQSYFAVIVAAIAIILFQIKDGYDSIFHALRDASFQVGSIITTTGFSTADFNTWSSAAKTVLVMLMFIGACAGSTGGGIKVSRFVILIKTVFKEIGSYIHPRSVKKIKMDEKLIEHEVVRATNVYFITFAIIFVVSTLLLSFENMDLITIFTAVAATINNIGPGLEMVGPTSNFSHFSDFSKYVMMFDMLAGRLELFPLIILFTPSVWSEAIKVRARRYNISKKG